MMSTVRKERRNNEGQRPSEKYPLKKEKVEDVVRVQIKNASLFEHIEL